MVSRCRTHQYFRLGVASRRNAHTTSVHNPRFWPTIWAIQALVNDGPVVHQALIRSFMFIHFINLRSSVPHGHFLFRFETFCFVSYYFISSQKLCVMAFYNKHSGSDFIDSYMPQLCPLHTKKTNFFKGSRIDPKDYNPICRQFPSTSTLYSVPYRIIKPLTSRFIHIFSVPPADAPES